MIDPNFILLYVADPRVSADFYSDLLGDPPIEASPTFAMFALESGVMLGLWSRAHVEPAASMTGGGGELGFSVKDNARVDEIFFDWRERGLPILQSPTQMDFGYTFVAVDPDGHRLRVFAPSGS